MIPQQKHSPTCRACWITVIVQPVTPASTCIRYLPTPRTHLVGALMEFRTGITSIAKYAKSVIATPIRIGATFKQIRSAHSTRSVLASQTNSPEYVYRQYVCIVNIPDTEPCNDDCRGNPIYPSTGQKTLVETDYRSPAGTLTFQRTYRSTTGYFASPITSGWLDNSVAGTESAACYPSVVLRS